MLELESAVSRHRALRFLVEPGFSSEYVGELQRYARSVVGSNSTAAGSLMRLRRDPLPIRPTRRAATP